MKNLLINEFTPLLKDTFCIEETPFDITSEIPFIDYYLVKRRASVCRARELKIMKITWENLNH